MDGLRLKSTHKLYIFFETCRLTAAPKLLRSFFVSTRFVLLLTMRQTRPFHICFTPAIFFFVCFASTKHIHLSFLPGRSTAYSLL